MRNLKRALSLGLASSMVLGTMAFSASAATSTSVTPTEVKTSFGDNDTIAPENVNAIYIAEQIGLTEGKDGGIFDPNGTVTRMEMAVICVNMKFGVDYATANFSEGDAANPQFSDLTWGYEFAKVAAQEGIIYGVGEDANGKMQFNPDGKVIAADALLMIMKTLGYFKNPAQEFAVDYKYAAGARATELSLYDEKEYVLTEELSREEVYAVAVRALTTCARVDYNYETGNYYNESAGYNSAMLPNNNIVEDTLGYQKFDLKAVDSVDSFNRPTTLWTVGGQRVSNFVENVHTDSNGESMEYTTAKTYQDIAKELTAYTKTSNEDYYEYGIFVDGMEYSEWIWATLSDADKADPEVTKLAPTTTLEGFNAVMDSQNTGHFVPSNDGVLTQVFVTDKVEYFNTQGEWVVEQGKVYVTSINTYLAEVDTSIDHETGEYTTRVTYFEKVMENSNGEAIGLNVNTRELDFSVNTYEGFEEDGIVMIQASAQGLVAASKGGGFSDLMEVITIDEPTVVEGQVTSSKLSSGYVGGAWMVVDDDETYSYSVAMRGELNSDDKAPGAGDNIVAYLDANSDENGNGYVLGYTLVEEAPRYMYVEENYDFDYYQGVTARVTFADGEEEVIRITQIDGDSVTRDTEEMIPGNARFKDEAGTTVSANENFQVTWDTDGSFDFVRNDSGAFALENRVFGYTQLTDGSYAVTTTIQDEYAHEDSTYVNGDDGKGAKEGGLLSMTGEFDGEATGHGTLASGLNGIPVKDTMAIFTSVYMPEGFSGMFVDEKAYGDSTTLDGIIDYQVSYSTKFANPYNHYSKQNEDGQSALKNSSASFVFALEKSRTTAFDIAFTGFTKEVDLYEEVTENEDTNTLYGKGTENSQLITTGKNWDVTDTDYGYDSLFAVNSNTVFVDVVNNKQWVGHNSISDLDDYNLNMQVVFGNNGIADVVFINNGADPLSTSGYFILMDTQPEDYLDADGTVIYVYNVYINGVETTFESKGKEISVTNDNDFFEDTQKLQTNTLYWISEKDSDGYVRTVDFRYDYTPITNVLFDAEDYDTALSASNWGEGLVYNNHWSVATTVSGGYLSLRHDDMYGNNDGKQGVGMWDNEKEKGENEYRYDDDTVFVVLQANKNGDVYDIRPGSASDIKTYSTTKNAISWVDVITASNNGTTNPYASLVVVLQPWPLDSVSTDNNAESDYVKVASNIVNYEIPKTGEGSSDYGTNGNPYLVEDVTYLLGAYEDTSDYTYNKMVQYDVIAAVMKKEFGGSEEFVIHYENEQEISWYVENETGTKYYKFRVANATEQGVVATVDLFVKKGSAGYVDSNVDANITQSGSSTYTATVTLPSYESYEAVKAGFEAVGTLGAENVEGAGMELNTNPNGSVTLTYDFTLASEKTLDDVALYVVYAEISAPTAVNVAFNDGNDVVATDVLAGTKITDMGNGVYAITATMPSNYGLFAAESDLEYDFDVTGADLLSYSLTGSTLTVYLFNYDKNNNSGKIDLDIEIAYEKDRTVEAADAAQLMNLLSTNVLDGTTLTIETGEAALSTTGYTIGENVVLEVTGALTGMTTLDVEGELILKDGGSVTASGALTLASDSVVVISENSTLTGETVNIEKGSDVTLSGKGATLESSSGAITLEAQGTLTVEDGAVLDSDGDLVLEAGAVLSVEDSAVDVGGDMTFDTISELSIDETSTLDITGGLTTTNGTLDLDGSVTVAGTVSGDGAMTIGSTGVLDVTGDFSATNVEIEGEVSVAENYSGSVNLAGGSLYLTGTSDAEGTISGDGDLYIGSDLFERSGPSTLSISGALEIGDDVTVHITEETNVTMEAVLTYNGNLEFTGGTLELSNVNAGFDGIGSITLKGGAAYKGYQTGSVVDLIGPDSSVLTTVEDTEVIMSLDSDVNLEIAGDVTLLASANMTMDIKLAGDTKKLNITFTSGTFTFPATGLLTVASEKGVLTMESGSKIDVSAATSTNGLVVSGGVVTLGSGASLIGAKDGDINDSGNLEDGSYNKEDTLDEEEG